MRVMIFFLKKKGRNADDMHCSAYCIQRGRWRRVRAHCAAAHATRLYGARQHQRWWRRHPVRLVLARPAGAGTAPSASGAGTARTALPLAVSGSLQRVAQARRPVRAGTAHTFTGARELRVPGSSCGRRSKNRFPVHVVPNQARLPPGPHHALLRPALLPPSQRGQTGHRRALFLRTASSSRHHHRNKQQPARSLGPPPAPPPSRPSPDTHAEPSTRADSADAPRHAHAPGLAARLVAVCPPPDNGCPPPSSRPRRRPAPAQHHGGAGARADALFERDGAHVAHPAGACPPPSTRVTARGSNACADSSHDDGPLRTSNTRRSSTSRRPLCSTAGSAPPSLSSSSSCVSCLRRAGTLVRHPSRRRSAESTR